MLRDELCRLAQVMATMDHGEIARRLPELDRWKLELAERQAELDRLLAENEMSLRKRSRFLKGLMHSPAFEPYFEAWAAMEAARDAADDEPEAGGDLPSPASARLREGGVPGEPGVPTKPDFGLVGWEPGVPTKLESGLVGRERDLRSLGLEASGPPPTKPHDFPPSPASARLREESGESSRPAPGSVAATENRTATESPTGEDHLPPHDPPPSPASARRAKDLVLRSFNCPITRLPDYAIRGFGLLGGITRSLRTEEPALQ